jgi:hypothetical protein
MCNFKKYYSRQLYNWSPVPTKMLLKNINPTNPEEREVLQTSFLYQKLVYLYIINPQSYIALSTSKEGI